MERYFKLLAISCWLLAVSASFTSCQEGREAGDLLGQWRLSDTQYISFSGSVVQFRNVVDNSWTMGVFGNFQHVGDSIFIQCYSILEEDHENDINLIENEFGFKPFNNIRVKVVSLDNDNLIRNKEERQWAMRKY